MQYRSKPLAITGKNRHNPTVDKKTIGHRRKRDSELARQMGERISQLFGLYEHGDATAEEVRKKTGVAVNTIWAYARGVIMPSIEALIVIARESGSSLDWLIRGEESAAIKDGKERELVELLREARTAGVDMEHVTKYIDMLIGMQRNQGHAVRLRAAEPKPEGAKNDTQRQKPVGGR